MKHPFSAFLLILFAALLCGMLGCDSRHTVGTIKIHALKSSARIIGAITLGDEAQAIENAGKSGDAVFIRMHHAGFIQHYRRIREALAGSFGGESEDPDRPEAEAARIDAFLEGIRTAADDMDCDRLESIFHEIEGYRLPEEEKALFGKLKCCADQYDYSGILELLGQER